MDSVIRAFIVYAFLLLIFRIAGKQAMSDVTTFDLVLTLIISEAIQQALIDNDNSMTNAFLLVMTLIGVNIALSYLKQQSPRMQKVLDGAPLVIMRDGRLFRSRMAKERVDEGDILSAARELEGLENLDQVKHATIEPSGRIAVIPKKAPTAWSPSAPAPSAPAPGSPPPSAPVPSEPAPAKRRRRRRQRRKRDGDEG